ncbi:unnamed protein product [Lymnaea stagnalis]|uniref:Ufm1-specific protease 2 n=1 Tax=Lymnaea stagnalis TaxID=6523 RepID=A0AAV2I229_LYMST
MASTVLISKKTIQRITASTWNGKSVEGFLIGELDVNSTEAYSVSGVWRSKLIDNNELKEDTESCLSHFSGGKHVVGFVFRPSERSIKSLVDNDQASIDREFEEVFGDYNIWLEQLGLTQAIVLGLCQMPQTDQELQPIFFLMTEDSVIKADFILAEDLKPTVKLRLKADVPLCISTESNTDDQIKAALDQELIKLQNYSQSGGFVFGFDENKVILQRAGTLDSTADVWLTCGDIGKYFNALAGLGGSKKKVGWLQQIIIPVSMLQVITVEPQTTVQYAPIIRHHMGSFKTTNMLLPIDVLVEVRDNLPIAELFNVLSKAVGRQISALFECLSVYTQKNELHSPEVFHFKPSCLDHSVTIVYPKGATDNELENERQIMHGHLCLPLSQPLLRRGCAGHFLRQTAPGNYLLNTHLGLAVPQVKPAKISLVDGYYSYHHYMQDRFDDDKWGCAYRSLQTLCSWFKYQGYTDKHIPSHKEIQQALVDIGDKEKKFVGSRQWIGSFEVSYVLDHLLGVTSKFITVNAGSELSSIGQELANHFETQGTPVMIGGGVLAHTILGVAYNELTGDISFLILDPHYTGSEDIKIIQEKGWCGWKDMNFWNQTAHYNLCLPQRPILI